MRRDRGFARIEDEPRVPTFPNIHWQEALIDGSLLGAFMVSACVGVVALHHPRSPVAKRVRSGLSKRVAMGVLMGLTAVAIIYSPLGGRSGAHLNPATTLTFVAVGKVAPLDGLVFIGAQFLGGFAGVMLSWLVLGRALAHESVRFAATVPDRRGALWAWLAEFGLALAMMSMVLASTNHAGTASYTGLFAGLLVALFIVVESPISGMSINPARTLASAIPARALRGLWIYFSAPPLGMLAAAGLHVAVFGRGSIYCAKLHHPDHGPCLFNCAMDRMPGRSPTPPAAAGIESTRPRS